MITRMGTLDDYVVKTVSQYRNVEVRPGDRVLDVGAHIGATTLYWLERGAGHVIAVEPDPVNVTLLRANTKRYSKRVEIHQAALWTSTGQAEFYANPRRNTGSGTMVVTRGRDPLQVRTVSVADLLGDSKIDVVKLDCEGSEYEFQEDLLAYRPRVLVAELHLNRFQWREEAAPRFITRMAEAGYQTVQAPRFTRANWFTLGVWECQ